ncbi:hypothetical protein GE09DRAFT_1157067 [Coniochaeta sp. 2T2.1]|nr:hypothetical protein GE09DRAFT_1157067 [Coniochaeta sp. 2T2.1]
MSFPTPKGQAQRQAPVIFGDMDQDDDGVPSNNGEGQFTNDTGIATRINNHAHAQTVPQPQGHQPAMPAIPQGQAVPYHQQEPCDHIVVPASQVTRDHPMYTHIQRKWPKERGRSPVFYYEVPVITTKTWPIGLNHRVTIRVPCTLPTSTPKPCATIPTISTAPSEERTDRQPPRCLSTPWRMATCRAGPVYRMMQQRSQSGLQRDCKRDNPVRSPVRTRPDIPPCQLPRTLRPRDKTRTRYDARHHHRRLGHSGNHVRPAIPVRTRPAGRGWYELAAQTHTYCSPGQDISEPSAPDVQDQDRLPAPAGQA